MNTLKLKYSLLLAGLLCAGTAMAHVNLIKPSGGGSFEPGQSVDIEWEVAIQHDTQNWDLYLSLDGGKNYQAIELDLDVKTLRYEWTVPYKSSTQAMIKVVQDNTDSDYSDESGDFTISGTATASFQSPSFDKIKLFPNPASGLLHINVSDPNQSVEKIFLYDGMGRVLKSPLLQSGQSPNDFMIDTSKWPAGPYWIALHIGPMMEVRKIIIQ